MKKFVVIFAVAASLMASGCATSTLRPGQVAIIQHGTVTKLTPVRLAGENAGIGSAIGGALGSAVGASQGNGIRGMIVGAMVGQIAGMFAGGNLEAKLREADGFAISVVLDNGLELSVTQSADDVRTKGVAVGSHVRVVGGPMKSTVDVES